MTFKEWFLKEGEWAGSSFIGSADSILNTPDYWTRSNLLGKGIKSDEPSFMKKVKQEYGKKLTHPPTGPIQDRVPKIGNKERKKEEKQGQIQRKINFGTEEDGDTEIHGNEDPIVKRGSAWNLIDKMYKVTPTYELKNMQK